MLKLTVALEGKRSENLSAALRNLAELLDLNVLKDQIRTGSDPQGRFQAVDGKGNIDADGTYAVKGLPISYQIIGIKSDGVTEEVISDGYTSRTHAWVTASKWAIDCKGTGKYIRFIVKDDEGNLIDGDSVGLAVATA